MQGNNNITTFDYIKWETVLILNLKVMKKLIEQAKNNIPQIIEAIKESDNIQGTYPAFYEGEHGYVAAAVKQNMELRISHLSFGNCFPTKKAILYYLNNQ